jgi:hypothetical protein
VKTVTAATASRDGSRLSSRPASITVDAVKGSRGIPAAAIRNDVAEDLSRRDFIVRGGAFGLGAVVLGALPFAERMVRPESAAAQTPVVDPTLQAFFDTMIPGKPVPNLLTELGNPIDPKAIAGVDPEHGAVYTDALLLANNPKIGFNLLAPAFVADLTARSLLEGGLFLDLDYDARERVCISGLAFSNPDRLVWEAGAAVPFTAFCAAGNVPEATAETSAGYEVMGHPGTAPHGYKGFSYRRRLNRGRTKRGSLP